MAVIWTVLAAYAVVLALLWAFQERITFPAPRGAPPDPQKVLGYGESIELRMRDETRLVGWYLPPTAAEGGEGRRKAAAVLWFYGNAETIGLIWPILRDLVPPDAALLIVDYPGYGGSGGRASEAGMYEAAELAYQALAERPEVDSSRIFVYGRSLGSAPALRLAAGHDVAGLILDSPFTSARDMAAKHYRIVPPFLVRLRLDNLGAIARVRCPVLVFHGTEDVIVPLNMSRRLAAAAPAAVEFVMIEGAGHNETYEIGASAYREKVWSFVRGAR
ncbi:MAG: alpha/beta hydrolase [Gemmatimonadales bacterium]